MALHHILTSILISILVSSSTAAPQFGQPKGCGIDRQEDPGYMCYCSGAIEFGMEVNKGIDLICGDMAGQTLHAHETVSRTHNRATASNTIYLSIQNNCDQDGIVEEEACRGDFFALKDYCKWSFDSHKGGHHDTQCFRYWFDVNT